VYTAEAQQIALFGRQTLIAGARFQWNNQSVSDLVDNPAGDNYVFLGTNNPVSAQQKDVSSSGTALYAYDYFRVADTLRVVGGLNFTHQSLPVNTATPPISSKRDHQERVDPKAAIIWSPSPSSRVRASYTQSLIGSDLGQSVRLEPTHIAGLIQTFRAPVPFSYVGALDGADLQTAELSWEGRFHDTYLSLGGQWMEAERTRRLGLFLSDTNVGYPLSPTLSLIREHVQFHEYAFDTSVHQLINEEWSFGARYRLAYAQLKRKYSDYQELFTNPPLDNNSDWRGLLHTLDLSALYRHHSGVFTRAEAVLFAQDRERENTNRPSDDFWEVNLIAGYRFPKQRAEVAVGVLNILDNNYRLDPINQHAEPPRSRTFYARLLLNF
jgi:outer membrane receptor protein involved in Fe transport